MKTNFKKVGISILIGLSIIIGCHKDTTTTPTTKTTGSTPASENYSSMANFFARNGVAAQTYTITGSAGGSFTSPQGTVVNIPANAFINNLSQVVTGPVTITFKDIYKKSDMLLSNMPTTLSTGGLLKSAGEFFIKATSTGTTLNLANTINVTQSLNSLPADPAMQAFVKPGNDTLGWITSSSAHYSDSVYVFSLYDFSSPLDSGSWCNSDNPSYFAAYTQGMLTLQETDTAANYNTYVWLIFTGINTTDACHTQSGNNFNFSYVPVGLQCTAIAVGIRGGNVYSAFIPITITASQTITFSMTEVTTTSFKSSLTALN